uniref:Uncharacterized protein n=1 Tax=Rangifer tarandus platyrhynchus TaxID=3082113 RepID=A0ACB0EF10_RANTA|nr:unnamed protein product [Rangifer tarandus platyrhynchus]
MGPVRTNGGARALSGLAVSESGLGAPRASTLPLDPQRLITFFSALERIRDGIVSPLTPGRAAGGELMMKSPKQPAQIPSLLASQPPILPPSPPLALAHTTTTLSSFKPPEKTTSQKSDLATVKQSTSTVKSTEKSTVTSSVTSTVTPTLTTALSVVPTSKTSVISAVSASAQKNTIATESNTSLLTTKDPTTTSTTDSTNPKSTSSQNAIYDPSTSRIPTTHSVTTDSVTTKEGSQIISTSPDPNIIRGISPTLSSSTNLESTQQPSRGPVTLAPGTSEPTGSSPEESNKMNITTSSGRMTSPTFTAQVTTLKPQVTVKGTQHTSRETPAVTVSAGAQQPTGSSLGPGTTSLVRRSTISSTQLTSNAPQSSSTHSPTSVIPTNIGQCHPLEKLNGSKLSLNISGANSCNTVASNHRLVEVLCQAVKPSFNKTQDECHIEMAPGSHAQEVDIKHITIITKLHPTDIYKSLKDDWDKLEDVGVRDMQFEGQGPPEEMEDRFSMPLIITIVCMASFLLLVAALYGCCHQRLSHRKDQQRLTEELQTVENGYHDNPTLEVMETSSEMQEKKVANLNGELGDSWIVPLDNLTKDDPEEEDTHL